MEIIELFVELMRNPGVLIGLIFGLMIGTAISYLSVGYFESIIIGGVGFIGFVIALIFFEGKDVKKK